MSDPSSLSALSKQSTEKDRNALYTYCLHRWDDLGIELKDRWRARRDEWQAFAKEPARGVPSSEVDCFDLHKEMAELDDIIWELEASGAVDLKEDEREVDGAKEDGEGGDRTEELGEDDETVDVDNERAVENLLEAIDNVYGEDDGIEDDETDKGSGQKPKSDDEEMEPKVSSWRKCPVPGCGVERNRLSRINRHLRDDHGVPLETGGGGDMVALRARQDAQFSAWCVANGLHGDVAREQPIDGEAL